MDGMSTIMQIQTVSLHFHSCHIMTLAFALCFYKLFFFGIIDLYSGSPSPHVLKHVTEVTSGTWLLSRLLHYHMKKSVLLQFFASPLRCTCCCDGFFLGHPVHTVCNADCSRMFALYFQSKSSEMT